LEFTVFISVPTSVNSQPWSVPLSLLVIARDYVYIHVNTTQLMKEIASIAETRRAPARSGSPLTVYFPLDQAEKLSQVSRDRRVSKANLVRLAVDRLLRQLEAGQLNLPLGIE